MPNGYKTHDEIFKEWADERAQQINDEKAQQAANRAQLDAHIRTTEAVREMIEAERTTTQLKEKASRRGPNLDTREKIRNLAKDRQERISENKTILGWVKSCENAGVNSETAKLNAPTLRSNWGDKKYQWREDQEDW